MIQRKNILAENMLRFRSKNIAAQEEAAIRRIIEQQTKLDVTNVDLIDALKGKPLVGVKDPNNDLIAFPKSGRPQAGDPAIQNTQGAVYQSGTGPNGSSYVLLGNIGKLTGGEGNWGIADNSALKVFTYFKSNTVVQSGVGNSINPEAPYSTPTPVTDPAVIISRLTKAKYGNQSNFSLLDSYPQKYIADLVKLFQTMNQLTDVPTTRESIMAYTRDVVAKVS
jgi:hypothetical protein